MNTQQVIRTLKSLGMTQAEMSKLSGVPQPTISRAYSGVHAACSEKVLLALLAVLAEKQSNSLEMPLVEPVINNAAEDNAAEVLQ